MGADADVTTPGGRRLEGKVALVTGAGQGIGRAIAVRLAAEGAQVVVNDVPGHPQLDAVAETVGGHPVAADVSRREDVERLVAAAEAIGPVQVLVSNAAYMTMAPFLEHAADDWWRVVATNLTGTYHLVQAALRGMRAAGGGRVVVVSSYWGLTGWPNATAYAASKAGLVSLTKTLGRELAPEGIIVNAVAPGVTATPQLEVDAADAGVDLAEMHRRYAEGVPLGRIGGPEEIAAAVAFLGDPRVGAMVGQVMSVNGGEVRGRA